FGTREIRLSQGALLIASRDLKSSGFWPFSSAVRPEVQSLKPRTKSQIQPSTCNLQLFSIESAQQWNPIASASWQMTRPSFGIPAYLWGIYAQNKRPEYDTVACYSVCRRRFR